MEQSYNIDKTPPASSTKVGWRIKEWARDVALCPASVYLLLNTERIKSVKHGKARIITTSPSDYLASLREAK